MDISALVLGLVGGGTAATLASNAYSTSARARERMTSTAEAFLTTVDEATDHLEVMAIYAQRWRDSRPIAEVALSSISPADHDESEFALPLSLVSRAAVALERELGTGVGDTNLIREIDEGIRDLTIYRGAHSDEALALRDALRDVRPPLETHEHCRAMFLRIKDDTTHLANSVARIRLEFARAGQDDLATTTAIQLVSAMMNGMRERLAAFDSDPEKRTPTGELIGTFAFQVNRRTHPRWLSLFRAS